MNSESKMMRPITVVSDEDFITSTPLFVRTTVDNFRAPSQIKFLCYGDCKAETDWYRVYSPTPLGKGTNEGDVADWSLEAVAYRCFRCRKATLTVIYKEVEKERRSYTDPAATNLSRASLSAAPATFNAVTAVMKLGQDPAPAVYVPKGLEQRLGNEGASLYRKSIVSRNQGYGLAAVAYMRRVVEDKTNELIATAAEFAEADGADSATVAQMRQLIDVEKYAPYEKKLEVAAKVFPDYLKVGDINPLQVLFREVSKGLHGLSEEACVASSDEIRTVFEYLFENLRAQLQARASFAEQLKKLANPMTR